MSESTIHFTSVVVDHNQSLAGKFCSSFPCTSLSFIAYDLLNSCVDGGMQMRSLHCEVTLAWHYVVFM